MVLYYFQVYFDMIQNFVAESITKSWTSQIYNIFILHDLSSCPEKLAFGRGQLELFLLLPNSSIFDFSLHDRLKDICLYVRSQMSFALIILCGKQRFFCGVLLLFLNKCTLPPNVTTVACRSCNGSVLDTLAVGKNLPHLVTAQSLSSNYFEVFLNTLPDTKASKTFFFWRPHWSLAGRPHTLQQQWEEPAPSVRGLNKTASTNHRSQDSNSWSERATDVNGCRLLYIFVYIFR